MKITHEAQVGKLKVSFNEEFLALQYDDEAETAIVLDKSEYTELIPWLAQELYRVGKPEALYALNKITPTQAVVPIKPAEYEKLPDPDVLAKRRAVSSVEVVGGYEPPSASADGRQRVYEEDVVDLGALADRARGGILG